MRFEVYGKQGCDLCKSAHTKLTLFLDKHCVGQGVALNFVDVETEEGAAEGDFYDVFHIPTVLLLKDDAQVLARWEGKPPATQELEGLVSPGGHSAAA
jgi:hypothetical protein